MRDAAERGVQLCQEAVFSDRGGECFSDRGGETWSPSCARSFAQIVKFLISGVLISSAGVSTEG